MGVVNAIHELFQQRGHSLYGKEAVTQMQHALQAASAAERADAGAALISAALLHDIGHLSDFAPNRFGPWAEHVDWVREKSETTFRDYYAVPVAL